MQNTPSILFGNVGDPDIEKPVGSQPKGATTKWTLLTLDGHFLPPGSDKSAPFGQICLSTLLISTSKP
jgi:hypothetical protein